MTERLVCIAYLKDILSLKFWSVHFDLLIQESYHTMDMYSTFSLIDNIYRCKVLICVIFRHNIVTIFPFPTILISRYDFHVAQQFLRIPLPYFSCHRNSFGIHTTLSFCVTTSSSESIVLIFYLYSLSKLFTPLYL